MVLLRALGMKAYRSAPTLNNFDIECGKSSPPILPSDVAVGKLLMSPLKFSFTLSFIAKRPVAKLRLLLAGVIRLVAVGVFSKLLVKSNLVIVLPSLFTVNPYQLLLSWKICRSCGKLSVLLRLPQSVAVGLLL